MPSGVLSKLSFRVTKLAPLLSKTSQFSQRRYLSMAAPSSKAVLGDIHVVDDLVSACAGQGVESFKPSGGFFADRSASNWLRTSVKMRKVEVGTTRLVCGFSSFDVVRKNCGVNGLVTGPLLRNFRTSLHVCYAAGPAPDVSFEGNSTENTMVSGQSLKLLSGSCYLPHPDKEETGGEDAHFICEDEHVIGVADGVGGWADVGIDAGLYSRELMSNSVSAIQEEPKDSIDPAKVLEKAHLSTKAKGSSTACIIALRKEGLQAINLGDSGFIVVRDGCTIFQSPVQQHDFNFTFQLDSSGQGDLPSAGQVFTIPVASGDAIVAGTDGLFDNLYNNEVTAIVVHAIRAGLGPQAAAQKIAALARERAQDRNRQTPFSTAAQEAGFRYYGGKLDDITVVVSYVANSSNV